MEVWIGTARVRALDSYFDVDPDLYSIVVAFHEYGNNSLQRGTSLILDIWPETTETLVHKGAAGGCSSLERA